MQMGKVLPWGQDNVLAFLPIFMLGAISGKSLFPRISSEQETRDVSGTAHWLLHDRCAWRQEQQQLKGGRALSGGLLSGSSPLLQQLLGCGLVNICEIRHGSHAGLGSISSSPQARGARSTANFLRERGQRPRRREKRSGHSVLTPVHQARLAAAASGRGSDSVTPILLHPFGGFTKNAWGTTEGFL